MSDGPFRRLGLTASASADEVRRARRELAKGAHPDVGGSGADMRAINDAADAALELIERRDDPRTAEEPSLGASKSEPSRSEGHPGPHDDRRRRDAPSFTVEALPVETFEALLLAAAALGEVEDDDPPYDLDVLMAAPLSCWCHLSVVPDAGASTVSLGLARAADAPIPTLERVRDAWIAELNSLDWSALG